MKTATLYILFTMLACIMAVSTGCSCSGDDDDDAGDDDDDDNDDSDDDDDSAGGAPVIDTITGNSAVQPGTIFDGIVITGQNLADVTVMLASLDAAKEACELTVVSATDTELEASLCPEVENWVAAGTAFYTITLANSAGEDSKETQILQGEQGPTGPEGPSGPEGSSGPQGATGPSGPSGSAGAVGPSGPSGSPGAVGPSGPSGSPGATGPSGPSGSAGATGPSGPSGSAGAMGPSGPSGPVGPAIQAGVTFHNIPITPCTNSVYEVVDTISINAPADGYLLASGGGMFSTASFGGGHVYVKITTDPSCGDGTYSKFGSVGVKGMNNNDRVFSVSVQLGYPVSAGLNSVYQCIKSVDSFKSLNPFDFEEGWFSVSYFPQSYETEGDDLAPNQANPYVKYPNEMEENGDVENYEDEW